MKVPHEGSSRRFLTSEKGGAGFTVERGHAVLRPKAGRPTIGQRTAKRLREGPKMTMSSKELMALLRDEPDEIDAD